MTAIVTSVRVARNWGLPQSCPQDGFEISAQETNKAQTKKQGGVKVKKKKTESRMKVRTESDKDPSVESTQGTKFTGKFNRV